ncbi:MAG TPA: DUF86 domain-containing protein, partial [Dehalococcoidia bacterium]|nr:DUF86 domain-containing protein [Dehalococcoidia bacterium]
MNPDRALVTGRLQELERVASELERHLGQTVEGLGEDLSHRWAVERGLLAGLAIIFDISDHILATDFGIYPKTYEESLERLHRASVISESLYQGLKGSGGFRNVLVHEYTEIDLHIVVSV